MKKTSLKKCKIKNLPQKTSNLYKVDYKKFKTLTVSVKYTSHSRESPLPQVMWWAQLGNLVLIKSHRAQRRLVSLYHKSNRPSNRAFLVDAQIYVWHKNNPEYIPYMNTQQIKDPRDLQEQSTFQCILITTQRSGLKKWKQSKNLWPEWKKKACQMLCVCDEEQVGCVMTHSL